MESKPLVPKLRFPEFRDAPGWVEKRLEDVCGVLNNRRVPITTGDRRPGPYPYYGASGIVDYVDKFIFAERLVLVGEDGAKWEAFEPTAFIAEGRYWVNNHAHVLKPVDIIDTLLASYLTLIDLRAYVTGAAPPKLTLGKLRAIPIPVSSIGDEQQKIAGCLTSLDELIAAEGRKLHVLHTYKKGLMQNLFPREGETVPRLRFPEFRRSAPWDVLNGDHLFDTVDRRPAPLGLPILAITQEQGAISRDDIDYHVSVTAASIANYKEVRPADFIISLRSFQGGIEYSRVHGICSPAYVVLKRKGAGSDAFYRQLFKSPRFIQQITRNIEGLRDGKMISYKQFSEQLLPAPAPPEQQKIGECLTSLDELIAAQRQKLNAIKVHKQGLMQGLFPLTENP